jgi:ATP-dependent protease ClpP protease subunit
MEEKYIVFEGIIEPQATNQLVGAIRASMQPAVSKITVFFSSLGGSIYEGFLLASIIQNSKVPICIHATNHIDSIANVIYMSAKERTSESYTKFYMHGASTGAIAFDEKGLNEALSDIKTNNSRIAYFISENSKITLKKVQDMMKVGTTISAQEALEYQVVHEIVHKEISSTIDRSEIIFVN